MKKVLLTSAAVLAVFAAAAPAFAENTGWTGDQYVAANDGVNSGNDANDMNLADPSTQKEVNDTQLQKEAESTIAKNKAAAQDGVPGSHAKIEDGEGNVIANDEVKGSEATEAAAKAKAAEAKTSAKAAAKTLPNTSAVK